MSFRNTKTPLKPEGAAKWQIPRKRHPRAGVMEYYLEGEIREKFVELFPKHSNRRMMQWFGISFSTLQRFKRELGLEKDMKKIRKEQARDVKRICEKNGYYASIRGKKPSDACIEGARKLRATGFTPIKRLKEISPRRYKALMRKKSEQRKELFRKEKLRVKYGIETKTGLRVVENPITHKASACKHLLIKQCNYFADSDDVWTVCYDSQTQRSAQREATAARHGLRIVAGCEENYTTNETDKILLQSGV